MNHSWLLDGVPCNFCSKCGIKKSKSYFSECPMKRANIKERLDHRLVDFPDNKYSIRNNFNDHNDKFITTAKQCLACELSNLRWGNYALDFHSENNYSYVTYYATLNKVGNKKYCFFDSSFRRALHDRKTGEPLDLKFLQIFCAYTEEMYLVKDILK